MLIDGNKMIEVLGLPEWDDKIIDILEEFGEDRPELENDDIYPLFKNINEYKVILMFDDMEANDKQREASTGDIYLNQIEIKAETSIKLPFSIEIGDSKETIEKKIGEKAYAKNKRKNNKLNWLLDDGEKKYFIHCTFEDETQVSLDSLWLDLFDEELEYSGLIKL